MRVLPVSEAEEVRALARQIVKSKRVAFVVGAGISTASGIPDFRSTSQGLFASLKEKNSDVKLASGKDLFHSNVFQREDTTRAFYMMMADLKQMADAAEPTQFHRLMKAFEANSKLFRAYTQNIDALEAKTGLSYGLGEWKETVREVVVPASSSGALEGNKIANPIIPKLPLPDMASPVAGRKRKIEAVGEREQPALTLVNLPSVDTSTTCSIVTSGSVSRASTPPTDVPIEPAIPAVCHCSFGDHKRPPTVDSDPSSEGTHDVSDSQASSHSFHVLATGCEQPLPIGSQPSLLSAADVSAESMLTDLSSHICSTEAGKPVVQTTLETIMRKTVKRRVLTVPQVIPLHGTLEEMHCPKCGHVEQLIKHLNTLASGHSIYCPKCASVNASRNALGERTRGIGVMKVSVVLYGEEHKEAARVGEIAEKDLTKAARPDFLIVAGTTLKIPGVKKLVKELTKVIKPDTTLYATETPSTAMGQNARTDAIMIDTTSTSGGQTVTMSSDAPKVIFVNNDSPNPESVWTTVFDTFVQGDIQAFASIVQEELEAYRVTHPEEARLSGAKAIKKASKAIPGANSIKSYFSSAKHTGKIKDGQQAKSKKQHKRVKSTPGPVVKPPPAPRLPKEKSKPGWKGWAVDIVENKDIFIVNTDLPPRRQPAVLVAPAKPLAQTYKTAACSSASSGIDSLLGESMADIRARLSAILGKDIEAVLRPALPASRSPPFDREASHTNIYSVVSAEADYLNTTGSTKFAAESQEGKQLSKTPSSLLSRPLALSETLPRTSSRSTHVVQDSQSPRLLSFIVDSEYPTTELYSERSLLVASPFDETDDELHSSAESSSSLDQQSKHSLWLSFNGSKPRFSPVVPSPTSSDSEEAEPFRLLLPAAPAASSA